MVDLSLDFAGLNLKNPFVVGSSELTNTLAKIKEAEEFGASAISTKLTFLKIPFYAISYHIVENLGKGAFYSPSGIRLNVEQAQELIRATKKETSLKIMANMMGPGDNLDGWVLLAQKLEEAGADMLELNMSCPNVGAMAKILGVEAPPELGAALGANPDLSREVTRAVVDSVKIPVMPKMTPDANTSIVAEECAKGGAQAISAINCPMSLPGVDIYDDGKPLYPSVNKQPFCGLCGPWIRPLAYRHVAQIAMMVPGVPILGGGGLTNWRQSVEMLMYGAAALSYCTIFYMQGFKVLPRVERGLVQYMEQMGYKNLEDFRGKALKYIAPPHFQEYRPVKPVVDPVKCNGCRICVEMGHCDVFIMDGEVARTENLSGCPGCAVCFYICPKKAISMVERTDQDPDFELKIL